MLASLTATLRKALQQLEAERRRLDRQIAGIRSVLEESGDRGRRASPSPRPRPKAKRPRMSVVARKAVSQRMKAYWAKRRAALAKGKEKKAQKGA
jgi:hypothetical protein